MNKKILAKQKGIGGITLIALVITIIVLLILAGVAISTLTGENGILTQAQKAKTQTVYAEAEERMRLAYMAVRAEIGAQAVEDATYNATEHVDELVALVEDDLEENEWTVTGGTETITMRYANSDLVKDSIATGKPTNNGYVEGVITLEAQTATFVFDGGVTPPSTEGGTEEDSGSISSIVLADDHGHSYTVNTAGKYYFYSYTYGQNFMSVFDVTEVDGSLQANKLGEYAMETGKEKINYTPDAGVERQDIYLAIFQNGTCLSEEDDLTEMYEVTLECNVAFMQQLTYNIAEGIYYLKEPGGQYRVYEVSNEYDKGWTLLYNGDSLIIEGCGGTTDYSNAINLHTLTYKTHDGWS